MWPGRVDDDVVRAGRVLKNTRAESMVMPCACSSLSASSRKAYSNGLDVRSHERPHLLELALAAASRYPRAAARRRALAVVDVAADHDVHAAGVREARHGLDGGRRRSSGGARRVRRWHQGKVRAWVRSSWSTGAFSGDLLRSSVPGGR